MAVFSEAELTVSVSLAGSEDNHVNETEVGSDASSGLLRIGQNGAGVAGGGHRLRR